MYPHWRSLLPHWTLTQKWMIGTFSFGFLRGMGTEGQDLMTLKVLSSSYNGFCYMVPPLTLYSALNLLARAEISLREKDPARHPSVYREWNGGINPNVFF